MCVPAVSTFVLPREQFSSYYPGNKIKGALCIDSRGGEGGKTSSGSDIVIRRVVSFRFVFLHGDGGPRLDRGRRSRLDDVAYKSRICLPNLVTSDVLNRYARNNLDVTVM